MESGMGAYCQNRLRWEEVEVGVSKALHLYAVGGVQRAQQSVVR